MCLIRLWYINIKDITPFYFKLIMKPVNPTLLTTCYIKACSPYSRVSQENPVLYESNYILLTTLKVLYKDWWMNWTSIINELVKPWFGEVCVHLFQLAAMQFWDYFYFFMKNGYIFQPPFNFFVTKIMVEIFFIWLGICKNVSLKFENFEYVLPHKFNPLLNTTLEYWQMLTFLNWVSSD